MHPWLKVSDIAACQCTASTSFCASCMLMPWVHWLCALPCPCRVHPCCHATNVSPEWMLHCSSTPTRPPVSHPAAESQLVPLGGAALRIAAPLTCSAFSSRCRARSLSTYGSCRSCCLPLARSADSTWQQHSNHQQRQQQQQKQFYVLQCDQFWLRHVTVLIRAAMVHAQQRDVVAGMLDML